MWRYLRDLTFSRFDTIPECDGYTHTDRQTDRHTTTAYTALSIALRGKNYGRKMDKKKTKWRIEEYTMGQKRWYRRPPLDFGVGEMTVDFFPTGEVRFLSECGDCDGADRTVCERSEVARWMQRACCGSWTMLYEYISPLTDRVSLTCWSVTRRRHHHRQHQRQHQQTVGCDDGAKCHVRVDRRSRRCQFSTRQLQVLQGKSCSCHAFFVLSCSER